MRKGLEKAYEITDAKISFVSLVDKAANKRQFLLKKEDGGKATFTTYGRIIKADAENHYVTGIVYEPMEEDSHGNYMTEEEITKAAYWFAKNGDKVDLQHSFEPLDGATVVENWIAKADFDIDGETVKKGTWLMTVEVADESVWEGIEKGDITGFSMGGLGNYSEEDTDLESVSKQETSTKRGLLKQLAQALGLNTVEKGAMAELYEERSKGSLFWNAFNSLENVLYKYDPVTGKYIYETDEGKVRECLEDFNEILTSILTGKESVVDTIQSGSPVEKAGKKMSGKNRDTLKEIYESLGAFLKEFDDPEPKNPENEEKEEKEVTKQEVEEIVAKSIAAAVAKATGKDTKDPEDEEGAAATTGTDEKKKGTEKEEEKEKGVKKAADLTPESIDTMVQEAIAKALELEEQHLTVEQVQEMITKAVGDAVAPIMKSRGLPSNLNGSGVEKSAGEEHYLHGIL